VESRQATVGERSVNGGRIPEQASESQCSSHDRLSSHRVEWSPSLLVAIVWAVLGTGLMILGFVMFGILHTLLSRADQPDTMTINFLAILGLAAGVLVIHEAVHGLIAVYYGARPEFGVAMLHKVLPVFYCTTPGHLFTRRQFAVFVLAPLVGISLFGVLAIALTPWGLWLVFPLAINFGGAVGDIWFIGLLLRQRGGTLIEDRRDGVIFHYPPSPVPAAR
jgi:hypothetical protein